MAPAVMSLRVRVLMSFHQMAAMAPSARSRHADAGTLPAGQRLRRAHSGPAGRLESISRVLYAARVRNSERL
jgi:hypothetical protein